MNKQIYPEPTCGALIFNAENKIFLTKSHKWKNNYVIPGGHIELGETMQEALKREVKEETNLHIFDIKLIYIQEAIFDDAFWKKRHFIFFDFICKTDSIEVILNSEAESYVWVTIDEALKLPMESYTRKTVEKYLKKRTKEIKSRRISTNF